MLPNLGLPLKLRTSMLAFEPENRGQRNRKQAVPSANHYLAATCVDREFAYIDKAWEVFEFTDETSPKIAGGALRRPRIFLRRCRDAANGSPVCALPRLPDVAPETHLTYVINYPTSGPRAGLARSD